MAITCNICFGKGRTILKKITSLMGLDKNDNQFNGT
jgi:hypothetical protein